MWEIDKIEEKKVSEKDQIPDGWVDSTEVAKITIPKCKEAGELAEPDYFISLDAGKENNPSTWNMNCLVKENKTFKVYVNALTGEFLKTGQAGIGW